MTSLAFCEHCRWCLLTQNRAPVCLARSFLSPEFHPLIWAVEREEAHFNDSNSAYSWGLVTKLHIPLPFIRVGNQNHNLVVDHFPCRVIFSFFLFFFIFTILGFYWHCALCANPPRRNWNDPYCKWCFGAQWFPFHWKDYLGLKQMAPENEFFLHYTITPWSETTMVVRCQYLLSFFKCTRFSLKFAY